MRPIHPKSGRLGRLERFGRLHPRLFLIGLVGTAILAAMALWLHLHEGSGAA